MAQLILEDGGGGVCVSTTKVVGVPVTSETSDGMIAVGRAVVAAMVKLAVVCSAVAFSAVVVALSPVSGMSWPGGLESVSWARAIEPARARTKNREAIVDDDDECSQSECSGRALNKFRRLVRRWGVEVRFDKIWKVRLLLTSFSGGQGRQAARCLRKMPMNKRKNGMKSQSGLQCCPLKTGDVCRHAWLLARPRLLGLSKTGCCRSRKRCKASWQAVLQAWRHRQRINAAEDEGRPEYRGKDGKRPP